MLKILKYFMTSMMTSMMTSNKENKHGTQHRYLDSAIRLRKVWKDRLAECASSYFEVDTAHWDDISPLQGGLT